MKKTTTTSIRFIPYNFHTKLWISSLLLFFGLSNDTFSQCSLTCNSNVQISLDANCFAEVAPDDILEGSWDISCEPFTVVVSATGGNFVTGAQIGQTLSVTVTAAGGNSCSGTILVKDYAAPIITCQTATISCFDDPDLVAAPSVSDNCDGNPSLTFTEQTQNVGCSGQVYQRITRTYTATDASGNSSTCDQIINVTRPLLNQVVFPPNYDDTDESSLSCDNPDASTSVTGVPTIDGQPIDGVCDYGVGFTDQLFPICQNSQKIVRTWTVNDWCNSTNITFVQTIKIVDNTPPNLICPADRVISVNSNECSASLIIPNPTVSDNCSSNNNISIDIDAPAGNLNGNTLFNLPIGTHQIIYTATDDCGNSATCTMQIQVIDEIAPVAICETFHTVGINGTGGTLVEAIVFDDGSYDNCSDLTYEVRRMETNHCPGSDATPFDAFVPFYCCDIGNTVMVELRVTDTNGNTNSCMVEATAQDEVNPIISCPADVSIDCGDDYTNLSLTGEATATDNCSVTISYFDFEDTDNCGGGTINRTWTATDDSGNAASCLQRISLVNSTPYFITDNSCNNPNPNDGVIWPCDFDTDACGPGLDPDVTGRPQIFEDFCDLIAVTYEDVTLPVTEPACLKILRTWLVVDWCQFDENNPNSSGSWEYTQVIKVLNSADPVILSDCNDQSFCSFDENCEEGPATLMITANDDCTDSLDLNYYYKIDLNNDGSYDITETGNNASADYPLGTHKIRWEVEDGCGNISSCEYLFVIADCKNPTPNVLNGLATELMENCEIEVWANDFDNLSSPSFDNCGIAEWVMVSPSQGPGQTSPPANATPSWTFSGCGDLGTQTVDIWILDINGNWAYVSTYILVQDNLAPFCSCMSPTLSGHIETEIAESIENVLVSISGASPGFPDLNTETITNSSGEYLFENLSAAGNYVVTPEKDINPLNGVSTYDLVLISKHILEIEALDSPYKMIAADANRSGSVTTLDLIQLRKLLLFIDTEFQNNTSWRFIDADFVFPNSENPWATSFPEVYSVNGLSEGDIADFIGMKIGDVNNSADTHDGLDEEAEARNSGVPYIFETANQQLQSNQAYSIPVYADDLNTMLGFQFTLEYDMDAIEVLNIQMGNVDNFQKANLGTSLLDKGVITASWHTAELLDQKERAVLFTLEVMAKEEVALIDVLKLNSRYTKAEAYNGDLDILNLELAFSEEDNNFILFQNRPNPFIETTTLSFEMATSERAALRIYDVAGKMVFEQEQIFKAGYHEIEINKNDLTGTGLYVYQLQLASGDVLIKKLVLTDRPEE